MLPDRLRHLFEQLEKFKDALIKNRVMPFRKEGAEKRGFRIGCVNRAQFNIQNHIIPAANSGRTRTIENLNRVNDTMIEISNSGFFDWDEPDE